MGLGFFFFFLLDEMHVWVAKNPYPIGLVRECSCVEPCCACARRATQWLSGGYFRRVPTRCSDRVEAGWRIPEEEACCLGHYR